MTTTERNKLYCGPIFRNQVISLLMGWRPKRPHHQRARPDRGSVQRRAAGRAGHHRANDPERTARAPRRRHQGQSRPPGRLTHQHRQGACHVQRRRPPRPRHRRPPPGPPRPQGRFRYLGRAGRWPLVRTRRGERQPRERPRARVDPPRAWRARRIIAEGRSAERPHQAAGASQPPIEWPEEEAA